MESFSRQQPDGDAAFCIVGTSLSCTVVNQQAYASVPQGGPRLVYYITSDQSVMLYFAYTWNLFKATARWQQMQNPLSCTMVNQKAYALVPQGGPLTSLSCSILLTHGILFEAAARWRQMRNPLTCTMVNQKAYALVPKGGPRLVKIIFYFPCQFYIQETLV